MVNAQQRLAQMEAQYGPNGQGYVNPQLYQGGPSAPSQGSQTGLLRGRTVTSMDEVRGAMIDLDGGIYFFPDPGNHKIYTKQINLDGTATINTYCLESPIKSQQSLPVYQEDLDRVVKSLMEEIDSLKYKLYGGTRNVQSNADDGSAYTQQPTLSKSRTDGSGKV